MSIKEIEILNKSYLIWKFLKFDNNKILYSFYPVLFLKSTRISIIKRYFERYHEKIYNQIKKIA